MDTKFTRKDKIGYGIASMGDTIVYNLLIFYSLYFLTDVVRMDPLKAGNVIFFATIWNAFITIFIGYISDNISWRGEKRLSYMRVAILPMLITLVMFFTVVNCNDNLRFIYYFIVITAMMTAYGFFIVPYEAFGSDISRNDDERTDLRSYARLFMGMGNLVGIVFLLPAVERIMQCGLSEKLSWQVTIFVIASIGACSQMVTCVVYRGRDLGAVNISKQKKRENIFREYFDVIKLKPFIFLLSSSFCISVANVFGNSGIIYFMKYNINIGEHSKAVVLGVMTITGIALTPILGKAAKKYDKKNVMLVCYLITAVSFILFKLMGIESKLMLCIYIIVFTVGTSAYWQLIYAMVYDVSELDECINDRKRGAILLSFSKVILRISNACATQLLALVLFIFGYDQNVTMQSNKALLGIEYSIMVIPAVFFICAALCIYFYPLTKEKHEEYVRILNYREMRKKDNRDYY